MIFPGPIFPTSDGKVPTFSRGPQRWLSWGFQHPSNSTDDFNSKTRAGFVSKKENGIIEREDFLYRRVKLEIQEILIFG